MDLIMVKGVRFRPDGLARESLDYLEGKSRRARRRARQERNPLQKLVNTLLPRDYRRVEVESLVSGRILVVGCSGGIETLGLAAVGIDVDLKALEIARDLGAHAEDAEPRFLAASGGELPFRDASFDSLMSDNVVEHLPDGVLQRHFREAGRVLRPGGSYAFTTPNRLFEQPAKDGHVSLHSYAEWEQIAAAGGFSELKTPRRRSGEFGDLEWKKESERRAFESGSRTGLSHKGIRIITLMAQR